MRVNSVFNQLLEIPGASVSGVALTDTGVEVRLRLRARTLRCECGYSTLATYDRSLRRWRHLDLAKHKLWLVYEIRRLNCRKCGVRTETVPWARPRARHTRDFEDTVLWLAQRTDRTSVATLLRCAWETVTAIIIRAVDEWIDEQRLEELYRIGVDEICYRHPNQYLTVIGNHDTGKVVGVEPGKTTASFTNFLDKQLDSTPDTVGVVSMDGGMAYRVAAQERLPKAWICFDPFHVMQWTNRALDAVFSDSRTLRTTLPMSSGQWRGARWSLRRGQERLTDANRDLVELISASDRNIGTAWRLKEDLRDILRIERVRHARKALQRWIRSAARSKILPMIGLAKRIQAHLDGIVAAIELGVSNGLIEGINSKIRLINARGYGHHSAAALTAMIYLTLGGMCPKLPTET